MNDIAERCASKLLGAKLSQRKSDRIQNIRLAGAVRAGYDSKTSIQRDRNSLAEGLESSELYLLDVDQMRLGSYGFVYKIP